MCSSGRIRRKLAQCLVLNTVIFATSYLLFHSAVRPTLSFIMHYLNNEPLSSSSSSSSWYSSSVIASWLQSLVNVLFNLFWIYPVYMVGFLFNTLWYEDLASEAFLICKHSRREESKKSSANASTTSNASSSKTIDWIFNLNPSKRFIDSIAGELYRFSILANSLAFMHVAQWGLLSFPLNQIFGVMGWSWLSAFFVFEYRWNRQVAGGRMSIDGKIEELESHWLYFLSFGILHAALSLALDPFVYSWLYSLSFPLLVLMSVRATPVKSDFKLPILAPVKLTNSLFSRLANFIASSSSSTTEE
jgi:etoposide-induced 2.4 mRNA